MRPSCERQLQRQGDPAYAERQARARLTYVLPGDRLVIIGGDGAAEGDAGALPATVPSDPFRGTRGCWTP